MGKSLESQFRSQKIRGSFEKGLFLLGLSVRLLFTCWIFEGPLTQLFVPFLQEVLARPDQNPWTLLTPEHFPYGSFLFGVLIAPAYLLKWLSLDHAFSLAVSVKLVLLIFDLFLFRLIRRLPVDRLRWCLFYWCNPVVIYVSFVHGQLDIVSMSLLIASIFSITERKILAASLFFLAALSSKFHVILAFPVLVVFLWNQEFPRVFFKKLSLFAVLLFPAGLLLSYPVLVANHIRYITIG
ncbi:MAG: hypothetical protein WCH11_07720, partial [Bdellovibrio sp.]